MKKNGVTTKEKITEAKSVGLKEGDDEDDLPTTEEVSEDGDTSETTYYLELLYVETLKKTFILKYDSVNNLINSLKSHDDSRLDKLIDYLTTAKITGNISPKTLSNILMRFILKIMTPIKIKDKVDKDELHLKQRDELRFYLKIFGYTPNTLVEEKKSKKVGYNITMVACENSENHHLLNLLVNELKGDINEVCKDDTRRTPLHIACEIGNLQGVIILVAAGADVNFGKYTPLGRALCEKQHAVVQHLLTLIDIDVCKLSGDSHPFLIAAQYATTQNFLTIMTKKGVDPNILTVSKESALSIALLRGPNGVPDNDRDNIVRILLRYSRFTVDCNLLANSETTLFIASRIGNLFALDALLEKGADCNFVVTRGPYNGHNVLSIAVYEGNSEIVERLIDICHLDFIATIITENSKKQHNILYLSKAKTHENEEDKKKQELIFELLQTKWIETHPEQVRTHINRLIKDENTTKLQNWKKFILSDSSTMPETGNTPLHTASANGKTKALNCLVKEIGVPIDPQNSNGDTPMHVACRKKQSAAVFQLLNLGGDPNKENNDKETPTTVARVVNNESCIRTFVQYSFNMGNELPSAESARADNDHLLAKVIDEFLPPAIEKAPEQPLDEVVPPKPKNKPKKKKNRNKNTHKEAAVPPVTTQLSPNNKHQDIEAPNNSREGEITPPLTTEPSPEMMHSEVESQEEQQFTEADLTPPPISEQTDPIETSEEDSSNIEQPPSQDVPPEESFSTSQQQEEDSSEENEDEEESEHSVREDESQEETTNESPEDQSEEDFSAAPPEDESEEEEEEEESNSSPPDDQSLEKVAILPSPPQSPVRYRSFFSHTVLTPSSEPKYVDINATLLAELKDAIENEFRYILSDPAHVFVKASLQNLIDYFFRLNYFAIIGEISENSPVLNFIRELRANTSLDGLDINRNVNNWKSKAIKVFKTMVDREHVFHLDYVEDGVKPKFNVFPKH